MRIKNTQYVLGGRLAVLAFAALAIFGLSVLQSQVLKSPSLAAVISAVLVDLANEDRVENAVQSLTVSPILTRAAQAKADDMAAKGYFAHVSPIDGKNSWHWFKQEGYTFAYAGENLAVDFTDSVDVERAWMNSPTHRRNILDGNFSEIGIATARGTYKGRPTTFVVQMFGTPARSITPLPVTATEPTEPTELAVATTESREAVAGAAAAAVTNAEPAPIEAPVVEAPKATWWEHLLATPKTTLQYAYYLLAALILIVLALVTELEFHRQHTRHVLATASLFVLMIGLFTIADALLFAEPVIAALVMRGV